MLLELLVQRQLHALVEVVDLSRASRTMGGWMEGWMRTTGPFRCFKRQRPGCGVDVEVQPTSFHQTQTGCAIHPISPTHLDVAPRAALDVADELEGRVRGVRGRLGVRLGAGELFVMCW